MQMENISLERQDAVEHARPARWIVDALTVRPPVTREIDDATRDSALEQKATDGDQIRLYAPVRRRIRTEEEDSHAGSVDFATWFPAY